jgi:hypothetical protein
MKLYEIKRYFKPYRNYLEVVHRYVRPRITHDPTWIDLSPWKKSDTVYILGSGYSINSYSEADWNQIRRADSIGFNFWLYHDHVPTYYVDEVGYRKYRALNEGVLFELQKLRLASYRNTPVLLKEISTLPTRGAEYIESYPFLSLPHFCTPFTRTVKGRSTTSLAWHLRAISVMGGFDAQPRIWYMLNHRNSIFSLCVLSIILGYRKIVLCGIDLNSPYYFFRSKKYRTSTLPQLPDPGQHPELAAALPNYYAIPDEDDPKAAMNTHSAIQHKAKTLTITEAMAVLAHTIAKPRGIQIEVALRSSALYPTLPSHFE